METDYDAWGAPRIFSYGSMVDGNFRVAALFYYRGYIFDLETNLYYLQSRYYDADIGRFINADSVIADVGGSIQGYNMFSYCFNKPVNMSDLSGNWPKWIDENVIQPIKGFVVDIKQVIHNYDKSNENEEVVFSANYFSYYKGTFVLKTHFDSSFSL